MHASAAAESLLALRTDIGGLKATVADSRDERAQYLGRIKMLEDDLKESRKEVRSLRPLPAAALDIIVLPHEDVQIVSVVTDGAESLPAEGFYRDTEVHFQRLPDKGLERIPRIVKIYEQMAGVALVQELFGVVDSDGITLAMMASMRGHKCIEVATKEGLFGSMDEVDVLRFAYELAATVSALHTAGLIVKVISDRSVYVTRSEGHSIRPKLTGLDQARAVGSSAWCLAVMVHHFILDLLR